MPTSASRRRLILGGAGTLALGACGGGDGGSGGQPVIDAFAADQPLYRVGETARITIAYRGGAGRIEPGIGPVASGSPLDLVGIDTTRELTLVVEGGGTSVRRTLRLEVDFRNRYRLVANGFLSAGHTASLAADGSVVAIGGSRLLGVFSDSIDRLDLRTGAFGRIGALASGRVRHVAVRLADGRILVVGGETTSPNTIPEEVVDPRTGASVPTDVTRYRRQGHTATLLADGRVLVVGGVGSPTTAELWSPVTGRFQLAAGTLVTPRIGHSASLLPDGRVLVAGGFAATATAFAEVFDPVTQTFSAVATPLGGQRANHHAGRLPDGSILLAGGEDAQGRPIGTAIRFVPASSTFVQARNLAGARTSAPGATIPDGRTVLVGGLALAGTTEAVPVATGEIYHPDTGGAALPDLDTPRAQHTVTRLADGRLLVLGGEDRNGNLVPGVLVYE